MTEESETSFVLPTHDDLESEFEFDADVSQKRKSIDDLSTKAPPAKASKPNRQSFHDEAAKVLGILPQQQYFNMDAYTRHKKLINDYVLCYPGTTEKLQRVRSHYKTDHDVIRKNHRFLWEEEDDAQSWGEQLAKKYYDRLFKEYCLCNLIKYRKKQIGMRWRTEKEVLGGKGHFFCGSIHCNRRLNLETWEVLFAYQEQGEKRSALVKLRLCPHCGDKLHRGYQGKTPLRKRGKKDKAVDTTDKPSSSKDVGSDETSEKKEEAKEVEESEIWKQPVKEDVEQSKEEAFEEYLEELFL